MCTRRLIDFDSFDTSSIILHPFLRQLPTQLLLLLLMMHYMLLLIMLMVEKGQLAWLVTLSRQVEFDFDVLRGLKLRFFQR